MPRHYFHVTHDGPRTDDVIGVELPNRKAAFDEATRTCGEMMKDIDGQLAVGTDWKMEVVDGSKAKRARPQPVKAARGRPVGAS